MADPRVDRLAKLLVNYSVAVKEGDRVIVEGDTASEPLANAVYREVLKAGGHPWLLCTPVDAEEIFYRNASNAQLEYVHQPRKIAIETYDVRIKVWGEFNTKALTNIDSSKMALYRKAHAGLLKTVMDRSSSGEFRWVGAIYPTNSFAQDAEMSLSEYEDFVYSACLPVEGDAAEFWRAFSASQQRVIDWLKDKKEVHIKGPETDLRFDVTGRTFINCDGKFNMPDGEVFTGPVEDSAEGHVYFSYPAIYDGHEVTGVRLWFEKGRVVKATAEKNEDFLLKTIEVDEGAKRVGELAIGTNEGITRFTREILFDEKIGGSFHLALGAGYPESGSKNESGLHWDMVCDLRNGGEILVDGELLYKNGKFTI
jgi:aminopeptidase